MTNIISMIAGFALVFYGTFLISQPLAYIILGLLILNDVYIEVEKD